MCSTFCAPLALSRRRVPAHGVLEHGHPPPYKSPPLRPSCLCMVPRAAPAVVACLSATPTLWPRDVNCPGGGTAAIGVGRLIPDVRLSVKSPYKWRSGLSWRRSFAIHHRVNGRGHSARTTPPPAPTDRRIRSAQRHCAVGLVCRRYLRRWNSHRRRRQRREDRAEVESGTDTFSD